MKIEEIRLDMCSTSPISTKWFNGQITRDGALLLIETPQEVIDFSLSNQDCTITLIKDGNVRKIELKIYRFLRQMQIFFRTAPFYLSKADAAQTEQKWNQTPKYIIWKDN